MNINESTNSMMLYIGEPHTCPYLPGLSSVTAFIDPDLQLSSELYGMLIDLGFRRSGNLVYRPHCPQCQECISVRIPVNKFIPNRSQRRTLKRNQHTIVRAQAAEFCEAHFELYQKYLSARHADSDMATSTETGYMEFVSNNWCDTIFFEFYIDTALVAVSIVDALPQGLSAVYTFFDPDYNSYSLGQFVILWLVNEARHRGLSSVYLGYWVDDCAKMKYKQNYRPIEALINQDWLLFTRNMPISA